MSCAKFPKLVPSGTEQEAEAPKDRNGRHCHHLFSKLTLNTVIAIPRSLKSFIFWWYLLQLKELFHRFPPVNHTHTLVRFKIYFLFISCTWSTLRWHPWPEIPCHSPVTQGNSLITQTHSKFVSYFKKENWGCFFSRHPKYSRNSMKVISNNLPAVFLSFS